jgi:hypothetical protein
MSCDVRSTCTSFKQSQRDIPINYGQARTAPHPTLILHQTTMYDKMTMRHTRARAPLLADTVNDYRVDDKIVTYIAAKYYPGRICSLTAIYVILSICEAYINTDLIFSFECMLLSPADGIGRGI